MFGVEVSYNEAAQRVLHVCRVMSSCRSPQLRAAPTTAAAARARGGGGGDQQAPQLVEGPRQQQDVVPRQQQSVHLRQLLHRRTLRPPQWRRPMKFSTKAITMKF